MDIQKPFWISLPVEGKSGKERTIKVFIYWAPYFILPTVGNVFRNWYKRLLYVLADTDIFSRLQEVLIDTDTIKSGYTFVYREKVEKYSRTIPNSDLHDQHYWACWYGKGRIDPYAIRFHPKRIVFGETPNGNAPKQYMYPYIYRFQILNFLDRIFCHKS